MDPYLHLNTLLVYLFNHTLDFERRYVSNSDFKDISVNDMHILEVIGVGVSKNMSAVAKQVGVTVGTLTIAINNLVKKGYVIRLRSAKDKRVVLISLSPKGIRAYRHHEKFHLMMIEAMREDLNLEECEILVKALKHLDTHFTRLK
jgi:DNA-binding MarR family transcriptional regulator